MKILLVTGSRQFRDKELVHKILLDVIDEEEIDLVIHGDCPNSPDIWADTLAWEEGVPVAKFPANWGVHGKSAGIIRNSIMVELATMILAFWDGKSLGTKSVIDMANKKNKNLVVINPRKNE